MMNVINAILAASLELIDALLGLYVWAIIISAILSWLVAFGIVNTRNRFVQSVGDFLYRITEPVLARVRRFMPILGGIDLSPIVVIFAIFFLQSFIRHLMMG
jgi:YggT family protein